MYFRTSALTCVCAVVSIAAAVVLPMGPDALSKRSTECDGGPYAPRLSTGNGDGTGFCEVHLQSAGEILTELEVWSDDRGIRGISFTFSSGKTVMQGEQGQGKSDTMKLKTGELVSSARLWGNGKGEHLGHIYLKTDKQEFDVGMPKPNDGYEIDVGGGFLLGAAGVVGDDWINQLTLIFLEAKIDRVQISDVKFDVDPTGTSTNIAPVYVIDSTFGNANGSTGNVSFTVTGSQQVTQISTWNQETMGKFGGSVSVEVGAEAFGIGAKITGGYEWSVQHSTGTSHSKSESVTIGTSAGPMILAPGQGKECHIFAQKGEGDFPYTSMVKIMLEGGGWVSYEEKGALESVQFSKTMSSCVDADNPIQWNGDADNPPKGVSVVNDERH